MYIYIYIKIKYDFILASLIPGDGPTGSAAILYANLFLNIYFSDHI
jgi:hypothetical protein